ncbi:MAG: Ig-like domain-containing protein [Epsilonproteobacteria bacterium]|nr:Ig-like domain-containing protein [Campylobacterota bacterium]
MKNTILKCIFTFTLVFGFASANTLTGLSLEGNDTLLNVGEKALLSLTGTYADNVSKAINTNITYTITPSDKVEVNGLMLTALKDGNVTVQATVGGVVSNSVKLHITWVVNGHVLPPEPDKTLNDSTFLGIDSNNNGVRDDVERWIYETYKDKHPIHIDIAMQGAKAKRLVLEKPNQAKNIHDIVVAPIDCESYYKVCIDKPLIKERINNKEFRNIIFNTKERMEAYVKYDTLLSGDSYTIPRCKQRKYACDFNTSKYGE